MKTIIKSLMTSSFIAASLLMASSCQKDNLSDENLQVASILSVSDYGTTSFIENNLKSAFVETTSLTDEELASLLKMKEEEKLAHDVYSVLYQKWGSSVFSNIANAENNHLNAVILLLNNYGITETTVGETGVFTEAAYQSLYDELITKASVSVEQAYQTGALIEEMDIKDLNEVINATTNENLILLYENLLKGSRNHLRAFNRQLSNLGIDYLPVYLSQTDYDQVINSPMEKGKQYRMNGQNGNQQRKGNKGNGQGNRGNGSCRN